MNRPGIRYELRRALGLSRARSVGFALGMALLIVASRGASTSLADSHEVSPVSHLPVFSEHDAIGSHLPALSEHASDISHQPLFSKHSEDVSHHPDFSSHSPEVSHQPLFSNHSEDVSHKPEFSNHSADVSHQPLFSRHSEDVSHKPEFSNHSADVSHQPLFSRHSEDVSHKPDFSAHSQDISHLPLFSRHSEDISHKPEFSAHSQDVSHQPLFSRHSENVSHKPEFSAHSHEVSHLPLFSRHSEDVSHQPEFSAHSFDVSHQPLFSRHSEDVSHKPEFSAHSFEVSHLPLFSRHSEDVSHKPEFSAHSQDISHQPLFSRHSEDVSHKPDFSAHSQDVSHQPLFSRHSEDVSHKPDFSAHSQDVSHQPLFSRHSEDISHKPEFSAHSQDVSHQPLFSRHSEDVSHKPEFSAHSHDVSHLPLFSRHAQDVSHKPEFSAHSHDVSHLPLFSRHSEDVSHKPEFSAHSHEVSHLPLFSRHSEDVSHRPEFSTHSQDVSHLPLFSRHAQDISHKPEFSAHSQDVSGCSDGTDSQSLLVNAVADAGIVPVVSAGNEGPATCTIGSPAAAEQAITVAAMADPEHGSAVSFGCGSAPAGGFYLVCLSSRGATLDGRVKPDVASLGVRIMAADGASTSGYKEQSGTSMSAPFLAGVVALMQHARLMDGEPLLAPHEAKSILMLTAWDWGPEDGSADSGPISDIDYGAGRLDAYKAIQAAKQAGGANISLPQHQFISDSLTKASESDPEDVYSIVVVDPSMGIGATLIMPTWASGQPDFDLQLRDNAGNLVSSSGTVRRQETVGIAPPASNGPYTLRVFAWPGGGSSPASIAGPYFLDISAGTATTGLNITTDGWIPFGVQSLWATVDTTAGGLNDVQTAQVTAPPAGADIFVKTTLFSDGSNSWSLGTTNGLDQAVWEFSADGVDWYAFTAANTLFTLATGVPGGTTQDLHLRLTLPSGSSSSLEHGATVTLVAVPLP